MKHKKSKSLAGEKVTYERMLEITEPSDEERRYEAFGHFYDDFFNFYLREFPGAYLPTRVRLSPRIRNFLESSRPKPEKIPFETVKEKLEEQKTLVFYDAESLLLEKHIRIQQKKDVRRGRPYIDLYPNKEIKILFDAEFYKYLNELLFVPRIANLAEEGYSLQNFSGDILKRKVLRALGFEEVRKPLPEQTRVERLIAYDAYPYRKTLDSRGYPLWLLYEVPVVRISFISEPAETK